ncbi:hypothetical protein GGX14DRAFT_402572 [Mycena pura]|uniref:Uncharacterized protein n=1 Tax=Mycena pura TaxID=153505 RepID=A0AAD6Y7C0_9AGAR|nr:hypothetical protein GGX14DRAFT_402572 [Mycena pura]
MTLDAFEGDENDTDAAQGQGSVGGSRKNVWVNVASSSTKGLRAAISSTDWRGMALTLTWTPESVSAMGVRVTLCGAKGARADVERIVWRWKMDLALTRTLGTDGGETGTGRAWAELERTSGIANWRIGEEKERAGSQLNNTKSQTRVFGAAIRSLRCEGGGGGGGGGGTETARVGNKLGQKNVCDVYLETLSPPGSTFGDDPSTGKSRKRITSITSSHMRSAGVPVAQSNRQRYGVHLTKCTHERPSELLQRVPTVARRWADLVLSVRWEAVARGTKQFPYPYERGCAERGCASGTQRATQTGIAEQQREEEDRANLTL